ncbi:ribosome maturation factor RimM [Rhodohalobacter halophilus]|uniref:ribosome maturation factor RimM n=1 Tax=Rhodohalobacter halophilus TaxID=1812810 RepID=UPI00083FC9A4|nr:ribosome maturation factor RimM [Rhodohalobacter halophilus]
MSNLTDNRFTEIGRFGRPRGLDGNIRFQPNENFVDGLFVQSDLFYIKNERSDLIPARMESCRIEEKRNQQTFFVKFDLIADRNDAEKAMNKALYVVTEELQSLRDEQPADTEDMIGYRIISNNQEIGNVLDIFENPAHPILEIKYQSGSLLIPMVDEYIDRVDHESDSIYCKNLHQLTEEA